MPRAFLITNKRYVAEEHRPLVGPPDGDTAAADHPPHNAVDDNKPTVVVERRVPSVPSSGAEAEAEASLPCDSHLPVPGDTPSSCPRYHLQGGEDLTMSPSKASSPTSMSPSKPDSPAHATRSLPLPSPHHMSHSPPGYGCLRTTDIQTPVFAGGIWSGLTSMFRVPELSELQHVVGAQTGIVPSPGSGAGSECAGDHLRSALDARVSSIIAAAWGREVDVGADPMEEHHPCPDCGKAYSTSSNLARHRQTHRSMSDKKARKCPHCEKVYVSMPAYSMHVRTHSQGCQCAYCGKRFSRPWLLQGHIRTHTGEKPFTCPQCGKAFADKSNLRAHVQTHSSEKPYACGRCGKAFALKSYLYKHEESSCMRGQRLNRSFHTRDH